MKRSEKEKWVEETLQSLDGVSRAQAPENLLESALKRAAFGKARVVRMAPVQVWSAAACALVLVVANLFTCIDYNHFSSKKQSNSESFAKEYFGASDAVPF